MDNKSNDHVGPRTARARDAFVKHFHRQPEPEEGDSCWLVGYVAALEDLPDELLSALHDLKEPG